MARARRGAAKGSVKVNFKDIETRTRVNKEGDYPLRCIEAKAGQSGGGNEQIEFTFEVIGGEFKGAKAWFYCPLIENSLWKLHALMTAMGNEVPDDEVDIDLSEFVDQEVVGVFTPDTYNGKRTYKMTDFCSMDEYKGGDEDDKKSSKKDKSEKGDKKAGKDKKEKEAKKVDYSDMDEDDLRDLYVERELGTKKEAKKLDEDELAEALEEADAAAAKSKGKSKKSSKDDDDDAEEEKSSKGKSKGKSKKTKSYDEDEVEDMDEDELQEVIDESGIDVDLDDHKKLPKKVAAVIGALKKAKLLS